MSPIKAILSVILFTATALISGTVTVHAQYPPCICQGTEHFGCGSNFGTVLYTFCKRPSSCGTVDFCETDSCQGEDGCPFTGQSGTSTALEYAVHTLHVTAVDGAGGGIYEEFLWGLFIAVAAVLTGLGVGKQIVSSRSDQATRMPLTAFETVENLDSSGKQTGIRNLVFGLSSDGSYFWYTVSENGTTKNHVTVFDAGAHARFVLDHPTKSITSYPLSDRTVKAELARRLGKCDAAPGEHTIKLGYDTVQVAEVRKTPFGPDSVESFEAPVLGCLPLLETQTFREGDSIRMTVTKIIEGEPDPSYFQRPPDYVERKPSDVLAEQMRLKLRSDCPKCESDAYANFDKIYASKHLAK